MMRHLIVRRLHHLVGAVVIAVVPSAGNVSTAFRRPANHDCVDAEIITGEGLFPFDNTGPITATPGGGPGCDAPDVVINDVWYCWTAPDDGPVTVDTVSTTTVDTKLVVYAGCQCPPTEALVCNDDDYIDFPAYQARATFTAQAGEEYLIQLGTSPLGDTGGGAGSLTIRCDDSFFKVCAQPDENCQLPSRENALASDGLHTLVAAQFRTTAGDDPPDPVDHIVSEICWWGAYLDGALNCSPQAADAFEVRYFDDNNGLPGPLLAGPFSQANGTLAVLGPARTGRLVAGHAHEHAYAAVHAPVPLSWPLNYWIEIHNPLADDCTWYWTVARKGMGRGIQDGRDTGMPDGYGPADVVAESPAFCIDRELFDPTGFGDSPSNDACENSITVYDDVTYFDTWVASTDPYGQPQCDFPLGDHLVNQDAWFDYAASCTGTLTIDFPYITYDTKVAVYEGSTCPPVGAPLACNDDGFRDLSRLESRVALPVQQGQGYQIRVGGYRTDMGAAAMALTCGEPPPNDHCGDVDVAQLPAAFAGSNLHTTSDCPLFPGSHSWMAVELAEEGSLVIDYSGSAPVFGEPWDQLALDCPCTQLSEPGRCGLADDGNPVVKWLCLPAGTYYYPILAEPGSQGDYVIDVTSEPCTDPCDQAEGDCFEAHDTPGCDDPVCCALVRPFGAHCCHDRWDEWCALVAQTVCTELTIHVDDDAPLGGDGTSWSTAFKYLQDALPVPGPTDQIHIAGGIYKPDQDEAGNIYPGHREAAFHLINGVDIKGGYRGCAGGDCSSGDPNERDIELYETILSGDLAGDDLEVRPEELLYEPTRTENSYHVFYHPEDLNLDGTAVLDGVTITGGNADGPEPYENGGGVYNWASNPTLRNCMFSRNSATWDGGGMYNRDGSPTLTNCIFSANSTYWDGGGLYNDNGSPTLTDCKFRANSAWVSGGGMRSRLGSSSLTNCTFRGNWAIDSSGGGICSGLTSLTVVNCTFSGNLAHSRGGGMHIYGSDDQTVTNSIIWGNVPDQVSFSPTVRYSNIQGGFAGEGNIDADPMFANPDRGDLRLLSGSPCTDAGDNDAVPERVGTDLDGNPRFVDDGCADDSGQGAAPVVDMGAYELQAPPECGNGVCDEGEFCETCACDCSECYCGDGLCTSREDCLSCPDDCECRTLHVPADYGTIQTAINAAWNGDEIMVAPGTYYEAIDFLGKPVAVRSSDGPEVTTIDATGRDKSVVVCTRGEGPNTVLDGFTITGGTGTYDDEATYFLVGGGMYNYNSSPTVTNCTFSANALDEGFGAGMYNRGGSPTLIDCTFSANSVTDYGYGGGMYNDESSPTLTGCTFSGNSVTHGGGAMYNDNSSPTLTNCTLSGHSADVAAMYNDHSNANVTNCTFSNNDGLAMYNHDSGPMVIGCTFSSNDGGGMHNYVSNPTVTNCTFSENSAHEGGGMLNMDDSNPTVTHCSFNGNSAESLGGGILNDYECNPTIRNCSFHGNSADYGGGAMSNWQSEPTVTNCSFSGNQADYGGGMYNNTASPTLTNCIFSGNRASQDGGGMYNGDSSPTLTNCTFAENLAANGAAIACDSREQSYPSTVTLAGSILWDGGNEVWNNDSSTITASYSDVQGGFAGEGNIDADPIFVREPDAGPDGQWGTEDDDIGDLRLRPGSPCIDAGDNDAVPPDSADLDDDGDSAEPTPFDLDGAARFVDDPKTEDTGNGTPPIVDMGAYEYWPDCNDNGVPDSVDLTEGTSPDCQPNGIPDECDIADHTSRDRFPPAWGGDGIPDECQLAKPRSRRRGARGR